jgi:hypothetical protein
VSRHRRRRSGRREVDWLPPEEESGYDGTATLLVNDTPVDVTVHLDGHLEPLDGRFHWYGRIERSAAVAALKEAGATSGVLTIEGHAPADVRLAECDPWGHLQVNGTGVPPYPMNLVQIDVPARVEE